MAPNRFMRIFLDVESKSLRLNDSRTGRQFEISSTPESIQALFEKLNSQVSDGLPPNGEHGPLSIPMDEDIGRYEAIWMKHGWEDLLFFLNESGQCEYLEPLANEDCDTVRDKTYRQYIEESPPADPNDFVHERAPSSQDIRLALPNPVPDLNFFDLIHNRRTARRFTSCSISSDLLSLILHYGFASARSVSQQSLTLLQEDHYEGYSHSRFSPFEYLFFLERITGIVDGVYRYDPSTHTLSPSHSPANSAALNLSSDALSRIILGMEFNKNSNIQLFIIARFHPWMWRYRSSQKYTALFTDAAALTQRLIVASEAVGLGAFVTPAMIDDIACEQLGTTPFEREPVYFFCAGVRDR